MKNETSNNMKRMAIAAVCVGMIGSGGLVQAKNTGIPVKYVNPVNPVNVTKLNEIQIATTKNITPAMKQMIRVPASQVEKLPVGKQNKIEKTNFSGDFLIAKAEVTGALWTRVHEWAMKNKYKFNKEKYTVEMNLPVIGISLPDVVAWLNACSEMTGLRPVYRLPSGEIYRDATKKQDFESLKIEKYDGYSLPTTMQSEIVSRWIGVEKPSEKTLADRAIPTMNLKKDRLKKLWWTPGDYSSGATKSVLNKLETERVSVIDQAPKAVCTKAVNALGICDMSGNVWEFTANDPEKLLDKNKNAVVRGGISIADSGTTDPTSTSRMVFNPLTKKFFPYEPGIGFRIARNVVVP